MKVVTFNSYCRTQADFDYRAKLRDIPRDMASLLALARDIELEDRIILDREHDAE